MGWYKLGHMVLCRAMVLGSRRLNGTFESGQGYRFGSTASGMELRGRKCWSPKA